MSSHSQISSPPPFSMVDVLFTTNFKYMGDDKDDHFDELIQDSVKLTQSHLNPWEYEYDTEAVKQKVDVHTFWQVFKALNELFMESESKQHWFSKEPGLFNHVYELAIHLPHAKFIYLVRDPRDVVTSLVKGGLHEQNVYHASIKWCMEQQLMLNAYSDPLVNDRIFMLRYEELIKDPTAVIKRLMGFIQIEFEDKQLSFYKNKKVFEHSQKSVFWQNLSQPINQENSGKFKETLSHKQIKLIESVCWTEMKMLGYQPEIDKPIQISSATKAFYRIHARLKRIVKKLSNSKESRRQMRRLSVSSSVRNRMFD